ncbi:L-lactate permease [Nocardioides hungaricus]
MFEQILDPVGGSLAWSAVAAALPLVLLFVLLGVFRVKAHVASLAGLAGSLLLAVLVWEMPLRQAGSSALEGAVYGVFPILWILVNALWLYRLTVITGWFEVLGDRIRAVSDDQRVLAILIAFCFGALLESLAGFGAPVAISAAMLIAAGMAPLKSAVVSLLANTAPVAFGAMAAPIITLSAVTGLDQDSLAQMAGRQTPFIALIIPFVLVLLVDGRRGVRDAWPIALVAGVSFGLAQFVTSNFIAVEITDIVAAVVTMAAVLAMTRLWRPAHHLGFGSADPTGGDAPAGGGSTSSELAAAGNTQTIERVDTQSTGPARLTWGAVAPYLVIIAVFSVSQVPVIKDWLTAHGSWIFDWPGLDVVDAEGNPAGAATFKLDHLKAPGTLLLLSGLLIAGLYRIGPRRAVIAYRDTLVQLRFTAVTVTSVLALAFVMNLSGQTASLGYALASTGGLFALLSPLIGWIGVAITGSDTSSNSLFGVLQVTAAGQAGIDPVLTAAANSSGGVLGKMLSPQNLAVAVAATGMVGREGDLFRKLIGWSLGLLVLFTVLVYLQSTPILGWMVP